MKILLLTDVPPCTNYTAGMVLAQIIKVLPTGSVACFCVLNPDLQNIESDPELKDLPLEYTAKPREAAFPQAGFLGELKSYLAEQVRRRVAVPSIVGRITNFAHRQNVDTIWAVLQGQSMVRIAGQVANQLRMPLFTHVWDPLNWWLRANKLDRWSARQIRAEFDMVIRRSEAVATASPAMSAAYEARYSVRSVALIACHDRHDSFTPPGRPHHDGELVIGMAGQFYANVEWQTLIRTLNQASWLIGGREVRLLVLGHYFPHFEIPKEKVEFLGWRSQKEAIRILAEHADVLYCPYPFDPSMEEVARLSFPSKLVAYFAAGRPVLLHAPLDSSPARFLQETGAGLVTASSGVSNVYNAIERLSTDVACFADLAAAAQVVFASEFVIERMRDRTLEFFGVSEATLAAAPSAREAFDPTSEAAHLPPPRIHASTAVRVGRAALAVVRRTPFRPLANLGVLGVRTYYRQKRAYLDLSAEIRRRVSDRFPFWIGQRRTRAELLRAHDERLSNISDELKAQGEAVSSLGSVLQEDAAETRLLVRKLAEDQQCSAAIIRRLEGAYASLGEQLQCSTAIIRRLEGAYASLGEQLQCSTVIIRELEGAKASLVEQLQGADRAYESLAETHRFLNQRFDAVASAALAKLDLLSQTAIAQHANGTPHRGVDGARYLDLLEIVLTGEAFSDPSFGPWAEPGFSPDARLLGRDWPQYAFSMIGRTRMRNVRVLIEAILKEGIPGDLIETGVWRGGATIYMRAILDVHADTNRTVWVADSFRGLPEPDAEHFAADAHDTHYTHPELAISADEVRANFQRFGLLDNQVRLLEGWFKDTLFMAPIERVALLRLDGDMYESTWQALEALYHKVSPGGFIIVDDYILPACAKAVDDWRRSQGSDEPLHEVDGAAVYWRKA
jgi:glycosyltransferase involved in cell wall biosynthesis